MPLPTPQNNETESEFIERCVQDNTMQNEFPDEDQRIGVCYRQWSNNKSHPQRFKAVNRQWSTVNRQRASYRNQYRKPIGDALDEHVSQMFEVIEQTSDINLVPQRIQEMSLRSGMIQDVFERLYVNVGVDFAKFYRRQVKQKVDYTTKQTDEEMIQAMIAEEMREFVRENADAKIAVVTNTSINDILRKIKEVIPEILEQGIGGGEAQTMLRDRIEDEWLRFKRFRTERIVRTETTPASSIGSMKGVKSTGVPHMKIWTAAFDETRDWHAAASGQRVDMDGDFIVNGESMSYPGDPRGSAINVINCNCALNYEVKGR